jgi:4-hydroxybenzoate polyprenyltransferase
VAGETAVELGAGGSWVQYLRPLRFDHWIKNLVVPIGSTLALVAHRAPLSWDLAGAGLLAFVISGLVSSVNYALNEILDAPFDARHPVKRLRPIPSGLVRVRPLLLLTAGIAAAAFGAAVQWFSAPFTAAATALFVAGLVYNLPPLRLKDWPYLDAVVESLTNPIRIAIGWAAVSAPHVGAPAMDLLVTVWACGAFLMTGKRLAELRALGPGAARYRPTFRAYSVPSLLTAQLAYAVLALGAMAWLLAAERPHALPAIPLIALLLGWALKMTFEPDSPLVDPEHLYRRPGFLAAAVAVFAVVVILAAR